MFRAVVNAGQLAAACGRAASIAPRTGTIPIIQNTLLRFDGGRLMVGASNLDFAVATHLDAEGEGAITCNAQALNAFVGRLRKDEPVELGCKAGRPLAITQRAARAELPTLPASDHQVILTIEKGVEWQVPAAGFADALARASVAAAVADKRAYLLGVHIDLEGRDGPVLVATDGHRLAAEPLDAPKPDFAPDRSLILPHPALGSILAVVKGAHTLTLTLSDYAFGVRAGDVVFRTKLVDGSFPEWRRLVPKDVVSRVVVEPAALAEALARVSAVGVTSVKFEVGSRGCLTLTGSVSGGEGVEAGNASCDTCDTLDMHGDGAVFGLAARYVRDVLITLAGAERIEVGVSDRQGPIRFRDPARPDASVHVIMPIRV